MKLAALQADALCRILSLEPRSRVLDLGCGSGRRTMELSRRGHRVLGLDPDGRALAGAREAARGERLNVHFLEADPRNIPYRAEFDAVVSLDSSFGRLQGDRADLRCLESAKRALKPGGKLVLDLVNREALVGRRVPLDLERGRLDLDGTSLRVYALTEVRALLEAAGLFYLRSWGDFDGSAYALESPRLIVLAEAPPDAPRRPRAEESDGLPRAIRIKGRRR